MLNIKELFENIRNAILTKCKISDSHIAIPKDIWSNT